MTSNNISPAVSKLDGGAQALTAEPPRFGTKGKAVMALFAIPLAFMRRLIECVVAPYRESELVTTSFNSGQRAAAGTLVWLLSTGWKAVGFAFYLCYRRAAIYLFFTATTTAWVLVKHGSSLAKVWFLAILVCYATVSLAEAVAAVIRRMRGEETGPAIGDQLVADTEARTPLQQEDYW